MATSSSSSASQRVLAIDALRGFDMFWIIGADAVARSVLGLMGSSRASKLAEQFEHVQWEGFRFYDLIFPLFLFLVGCSLPYSLEKYRQNPTSAYWRIFRRVAALVLLGLVANGLLKLDWGNLRYAGVLQRIGICYGIGALIYLNTSTRGQIVSLLGVLIGYWAILRFVPAPGGIAGDLSIEGNLSGWLDRKLLPGKIMPQYYGYGDNEGILSTIPAVATVLSGVLASHVLRSSLGNLQKILYLACAGIAAVYAGYLWNGWFPIIKNLWTSSFVLVSSGWSLVLLAAFYAVIDVVGLKRWSMIFVIVGMNAITIYVAQRFIDFKHMSQFFLSGVARISGYEATVLLAGTLLFKMLFLWFLYSRKIFLRV